MCANDVELLSANKEVAFERLLMCLHLRFLRHREREGEGERREMGCGGGERDRV